MPAAKVHLCVCWVWRTLEPKGACSTPRLTQPPKCRPERECEGWGSFLLHLIVEVRAFSCTPLLLWNRREWGDIIAISRKPEIRGCTLPLRSMYLEELQWMIEVFFFNLTLKIFCCFLKNVYMKEVGVWVWVSVPVCTCRVRPAYSSHSFHHVGPGHVCTYMCACKYTPPCTHMLVSNVKLISGGIRIIIEQSSSRPHG